MKFEWDSAKAAANRRKHGITFEEAAECFRDPLAIILDEPRYPDRSILIGLSLKKRLVLTVYLERDVAVVRIISARLATANERKVYEEGDY